MARTKAKLSARSTIIEKYFSFHTISSKNSKTHAEQAALLMNCQAIRSLVAAFEAAQVKLYLHLKDYLKLV